MGRLEHSVDSAPDNRRPIFGPGNQIVHAKIQSVLQATRRFLASEDGPTAVEYALMLSLIVLVCITSIKAIGTSANTTFGKVSTKLGS